jgi:N utilization substance protein A
MNADLLRFVDSISRDKNIEKENVFADLEAAMLSAARRAFDTADDIYIGIDRVSGDIQATVDGDPIDMRTLGRIAAQTAKQVLIQKVREDERNAIFDEYSERVGTVVTGTVSRYEAGGLVVNLGRGEGFLPRSEQIPGHSHQPGERIRAMILDVREAQNQVKIVLTQNHPDYIRKLFELEVPEVGERIIEIRALAREAGYRTKIAVSSIDMKVDAVGACVGVRGSRIRNIVDELGGEKIDIVRWNESSQILISNALKPAEVKEIFLCFELGRATVIVAEDQLSLAIGKRGQNVRLAARLTGWDIDILTPAEYDRSVEDMERTLKGIEGVEDVLLDKLLALGIISLADLVAVGAEPLVEELTLEQQMAEHLVAEATEGVRKLEAAKAAAKEAEAQAAAAAAAAEAEAADARDGDGEGSDAAVVEGAPAVAGSAPDGAAADVVDDASTPSDAVGELEGPEAAGLISAVMSEGESTDVDAAPSPDVVAPPAADADLASAESVEAADAAVEDSAEGDGSTPPTDLAEAGVESDAPSALAEAEDGPADQTLAEQAGTDAALPVEGSPEPSEEAKSTSPSPDAEGA